MSLKGQTILVTGGARRIGRAIAQSFAEAGARVVVHYHRSEGAARDLVAELRGTGGEAIALAADLTRPDAIHTLAEQAGPVRVLVNSASLFERATLEDCSPETWERQMAVNLRAPFLLTQALAPGMRRAGGGVIVNLLDVLVKRPVTGYSAYVASKAALWGLTRQLARELAPDIRVNGVALGPVLPEPGLDPLVVERIAQRLPVARWGDPEEVARIVLFLARDATFATGAVWHLDGGMAIQ